MFHIGHTLEYSQNDAPFLRILLSVAPLYTVERRTERGQNQMITAELNEKGEGYDRYGEPRTTILIKRDIILHQQFVNLVSGF